MHTSGLYGNRVLTQRESRIVQLVAQGLTNRDVAQAVGTTEHVVKNWLRVIYDKLGLWNRVELALWYEARIHRATAGPPPISPAERAPQSDGRATPPHPLEKVRFEQPFQKVARILQSGFDCEG
jgi:DNA-binding CsgD family transcriptional regulator